VGAFGAQALLHNLTDSDYNKPLDEVRDLFWNAPRMPLLPGADNDLKRALFEATNAGKIVLLGSDGIERHVSTPDEIGVGQASLHLEKPRLKVAGDEPAAGPGGSSGGDLPGDPPTLPPDGPGGTTSSESELTFTLMASLASEDQRFSVFQLLNAVAKSIDDGNVSYSKVSVSLVIGSSDAKKIEELAKAANTTATIKPR
jgi:hypothetical protein